MTSEHETFDPPNVSAEADEAKEAAARMANVQPQVALAPSEGGPEPTPPTDPYSNDPDAEAFHSVREPAPPAAAPGEGVPVPGSYQGPSEPEAPPTAVVKEALGQTDPEPVSELPDGERRFVSPKYRGGKFLVKAGELVMVPSPRGPWARERVGDIWVDFKSGNGIFSTTDPIAIAWCEAHPEVCRDAFDPKTPAWVAVVEATLETATQAARLPANTDIDALLRGEASGLGGSDLVRRARGG